MSNSMLQMTNNFIHDINHTQLQGLEKAVVLYCQQLLVQSMQKLCPQGIVAGPLSCSWSSRSLSSAILMKTMQWRDQEYCQRQVFCSESRGLWGSSRDAEKITSQRVQTDHVQYVITQYRQFVLNKCWTLTYLESYGIKCLSIHTYLSSVCPSIYLYISLRLSVYLSVCLSNLYWLGHKY